MHISKQLKVKNKLAAKSFFRTSEMKLIKFLNIFTTWNPIGQPSLSMVTLKTGTRRQRKKETKKQQAMLASRVVKTLPKIRIQWYFLIFETLTNFTTLAE